MQNARTSTVRAQTVEKPWRVQEGRSSLELLIVPGSVYGGRGAIESGRKSHFPEQNWREGAAGSFLSRPTALSKKPHATLQCSFRLSKTFAEFERVEILSIFQLYPAAYTSGRDDLCGRKSHFPEQNWREGAAGSLPSSLTALSNLFDKLTPGQALSERLWRGDILSEGKISRRIGRPARRAWPVWSLKSDRPRSSPAFPRRARSPRASSPPQSWRSYISF